MHADDAHEQQVQDAEDEKVLQPCLILLKQRYMTIDGCMRNQVSPTSAEILNVLVLPLPKSAPAEL